MEFAFKMEFQAFMQILTDRLTIVYELGSQQGEAINISDKKFYSKWLNLVHNYPLDTTTNINELLAWNMVKKKN